MKNSPIDIISHLYYDQDSNRWIIQTNEEHCAGVAEFAFKFANKIDMGNWGRLLGLIHDRGKEKEDFQRYIKIKSGYDRNVGKYGDKSHSLIGALLLDKKYKDGFRILPNIIAGHHRGLYDTDSLELLLQKDIPCEVSNFIPDLRIERPNNLLKPKDLSHLTRILFSCLTDADYLDTEKFMNHACYESRSNNATIKDLKIKLDSWIEQNMTTPENSLNTIRQDIQNRCREKSLCPSGFFELTVPTGGGKTISSIVWAIDHAYKCNKDRIIIAIPYTSIIIQTANVLKKIFGADNVLEHHSVVDEENTSERTKLLSENWDAPIVVTTNVQLFESMFSNKPGKCRKLHSLCNSVLILDEVQNLPLSFLQPIVDSLGTYVKLFKMSVLLCTASQPVLNGDIKGLGQTMFNGIKDDINSIIPETELLHDKMRRVKIEMPTKPESLDSVAKRLSVHNRVLCIVNTRKLASELYTLMPCDGDLIHLSRMMCSRHIQDKIDEIRHLLESNSEKPLRVISTQLIEAGVDIDFPVVYRQFTGLDSILQAAGRCNREAKGINAKTFVFEIAGHISRGLMGITSDAMKQLLSMEPESDWLAPETMRKYYQILYSKCHSFDKENIVELTNNPDNISFETVADKFKLIDDKEINVIVNYGNASEYIDELRKYGSSKNILKQLGQYSVGIRPSLFYEFYKMGIIDEPYEGVYYIPLKEQYDDNIGLKVNNEYIEQSFVI